MHWKACIQLRPLCASRGSRSSSPSTTSAPGLAITRDDEELPVLDPVTDYEKIGRVGEGTYG